MVKSMGMDYGCHSIIVDMKGIGRKGREMVLVCSLLSRGRGSRKDLRGGDSWLYECSVYITFYGKPHFKFML